MGLTTAMYTGLSGLVANSQAIQVTGDNIANVNTVGYKSSRADFQSQITQVLRQSTGPSGELGGTNPSLVGFGVAFGSIAKNFSGGSVQTTGVNTEMAIEGEGFFILDFAGSQRFSRAGNFLLDRNNNLVNPNGGLVQGFGVDNDFNVVQGTLQSLNVPIGTSTLAEATENVRFAGNLNAGGNITTQGSITTSSTIFSDVGLTTQAVAGDALTSLFNANGQMFNLGDIITVQDATKGSAKLPPHTFEVGAAVTGTADIAGTTLQDFMTFLEDVLGIDTTVSGGIALSAGQITITGNGGTVNDLEVAAGNIIRNAGSATPGLPFNLTKAQSADGESVRTTFFGFDSLGNELQVDVSVVLEQKTNAGTTWRFYAQSEADSDLSRVLGNGTMSFDTSGRIITVNNADITIDRNSTGALTPQQMHLAFDSALGSITALADSQSTLNAVSQDGSPIGVLENFNIGEDGTISGIYSNGLIRTQGRIALARFANPAGLSAAGANLFTISANSGTPQVMSPQVGGAGRILGGALELSNVELSQEFINLITASTGFTASSRVLTTSEEMIQELLNTIR
ncbi:MAG: flagellar hook-basal body complex protein [Phycisphaeraceae bacterium]